MGVQGFAYSNLLQELLLSLVGYTGDVFVQPPLSEEDEGAALLAPTQCRMRLSTDLQWIEEPDREVLNNLVRLGFHYQAVSQFVELECTAPQRATAEHMPHTAKAGPVASMYRRALATGLSEILDVYRAAVLHVQQQVQADEAPVLARLHFYLSDFMTLLPALHRLAHQVYRTSNMRCPGAQLLELLHEAGRSGVQLLHTCMTRLLWHCNQVLYRQLSSWMVHGVLLDPHDEFFIMATPGQPAENKAEEAEGSTYGQALPDSAAYQEWRSGFQVRHNEIPSCISPDLADTICFIGRAVSMLKQPRGEFKGAELLPYRDTLEFAAALQVLQQEPVFNRFAFERTVESIRAKVVGVLWHLLVVQGGLMGHLAAIKDYFLLARGDLYQSFLVDSAQLMSLPPRLATADADVDIPFQAAAAKSSASNDRLFSHFRMRFAPTEPKGAGSTSSSNLQPVYEVPRFDDNWDGVYLDYQMEWPLGLLITPTHIVKYNALLQLLLRLKRVQLRLEEAWQSLGGKLSSAPTVSCTDGVPGRADRQAADSVRGSAGPTTLRQLRYHMAHLINNLQIYIQTDVIESAYQRLEGEIAAAQDYSEAERAHNLYLHTLISQSFLTSNTICGLISSVFSHVKELCIEMGPAGLGRHGHGINYARVAEIDRDFMRTASTLYTNLNSSRLQESDRAPHLRQLYMRLDYNHYVYKSMRRIIV